MVASPHLAPKPPSGGSDRSAASVAGESTRIVLADAHAPTRDSLRLLLDREEGLEVVAEADDHGSAAPQIQRHRPHVLVLGLELRESSSIEAVRALRERAAQTKIVVLSAEEDPVLAQRALTAGATAVVARDLVEAELAQAVRAAALGEEYVSPHLAARLDALHRSLTDNKLTPREVEVLRLIAFGHTSVEIARMLHLSPRTIETHRAHIHKKLDLGTRAELVRYALRRGLIGA